MSRATVNTAFPRCPDKSVYDSVSSDVFICATLLVRSIGLGGNQAVISQWTDWN